MADDTSLETTGARSGLGRKLVIALAGLLVLLVALYFVISSSAFLKGVVLPRVGKALNAEITAGEASLKPFSELSLTRLKVQPAGAEPLLTAEQVRVRYSLFSILRGNYVVNELSLISPIVQIVRDPEGKSNLDPVLEGLESDTGAKSDEDLRLAIRNVSVKDAVVRTVAKAKDGSVKTTELDRLNLTLDRLENGESGQMKLTAAVRLENRVPPGGGGTNDLLQGQVEGGFDFKLDPKLLPQTVTGNANAAFARAEGAYEDLAGLAAVLQAEMTPTEVRQLALQFERGGQSLGRIQAGGPLDLAKSEGRLKLEVQSIDRQVLNLFGAGRGWDFADSRFNATNFVDIARQGEVIGAKGQLAGRQISIRQQGESTPVVDLDVDYDVTLNLGDQTAVIRALTILGRQQQQDFLRASLDRPMTLTWAPAARGFADSTFQLALTQLNLAEWQSVLGTNAPSGRLDLQLNVVATKDGKELTAKSSGRIQDFAARFDTNSIEQADVTLDLQGKLTDFKKLSVSPYKLLVQQQGQPLLKADGTLNYDLSQENVSLQANAEVVLPALLRQFPLPPLSASKGVIRLSSAVTQKEQKYSVTGNVSLGDFTGSYGDYVFQDYQTALDYNVDLNQPVVQIHSASVAVRKGYSAGGNAGLSGVYDLDRQSARLTFKLNLNEHALEPFLAPSLGENKLVSISLNGAGSTTYDPQGDSSIKADLGVTNWVVAMAQQQSVSPKLGAQMQLDVSMRQQNIDLRQLLVKLSPTQDGQNEIQLTGRLDLAETNASPSQITLQAESLDLRPYYAMFTQAGADAAAVPAELPPPAPAQEVEPEPARLPFEQLVADVKLGRVFLGDLAVTNLQSTARIDRGQVTVKPLQMTLNGGAVNASALLNLAVPGYTYDVVANLDRVPLDPLSTTFTTNAPGQYQGDLMLQAQIRGAGITGPSLQKNLSGKLSLNLTNMQYQIVGRKTQRVIEPVALVLRVPELTQTPLHWLAVAAELGKGQIDLQQFIAQSPAFHAEARGQIPMAETLTNSPLNGLPVSLSLRRSLAEKANLVPANAPTNTYYVQLPTFVSLQGTLGDPRTEINKIVIGGLLARSIGGIAPVGEQAGAILQNLGGVLSGQPAAGTNVPPSREAVATNLLRGLSDLITRPRQENSATNAPAPSTNKPARPSLRDLLR